MLKRLLGAGYPGQEAGALGRAQAPRPGAQNAGLPRADQPLRTSHLQREEGGGCQTAGTIYEEATGLSGTHSVAASLVHRPSFRERKSKGRGRCACRHAAHSVSPGELGAGPGAERPEKHGESSKAPGLGRPALTFCQPGEWEDVPQVGLDVPLLRNRILLLQVLEEDRKTSSWRKCRRVRRPRPRGRCAGIFWPPRKKAERDMERRGRLRGSAWAAPQQRLLLDWRRFVFSGCT